MCSEPSTIKMASVGNSSQGENRNTDRRTKPHTKTTVRHIGTSDVFGYNAMADKDK